MTTETTKMAEAMKKAEVKTKEKAKKVKSPTIKEVLESGPDFETKVEEKIQEKADEKLSKRGQVREIPIDSIDLDPEQPRKNKPDSYIEELGNSIAQYGIMNYPHVEKIEDSKPVRYKMVNGECRLLAFRQNEKLKAVGKIPCIIRDYSDKTVSEKFLEQILDNTVRKDMDTMETVDAYQAALDKGATIEQLSDAVGKDVKTIEADLPLVKLTPAIRSAVDGKTISKEVARAIAKLGKENKMEKAYAAAVRARNSKQQLANVQNYANQVNQNKLELTSDKTTTGGDLKTAGKYLDALLGSIKRFAGLTLDKTLMIKARSKKLEEVEVTAKEMIKQAEILLGYVRDYKAKTNTG